MDELFLKIEGWAFQLDESPISGALSVADEKRAAQIPDPLRRLRYERSRLALRRVLAVRLGQEPESIAFEIAPGGKPKVAGCEFSISHSGPWLVVAVSKEPVGVDIEIPGDHRNFMRLAERFFSAQDVRSLSHAEEASGERAFMRQWVAKEAALKCAGAGLARYLHRAECVMDKSAVVGVRWDASRFSVREFALPDGTPGAVSWCGDGKTVVRWHAPAEIDLS